MRYFFNIKDGVDMLDEHGVELDGMDAVRIEAVQSSADMLKGLCNEHFWSGEPWMLWVTNKPKGEGDTFLTLTFSSRLVA
jgi:hypothetical protein